MRKENPYALLLDLARRKKADLASIALGELTMDYLEWLENNKVSLENQVDFLVLAATLLKLKLKRVLPDLKDEEEAEEELKIKLNKYAWLQGRAQWIKDNWGKRPLFCPRKVKVQPWGQPPIKLGLIIAAMDRVLVRQAAQVKPTVALRARGITLEFCQQRLIAQINQLKIIFLHEVLAGRPTIEIALSLLASLDLVKQSKVELIQEEAWAPIRIQANLL